MGEQLLTHLWFMGKGGQTGSLISSTLGGRGWTRSLAKHFRIMWKLGLTTVGELIQYANNKN